MWNWKVVAAAALLLAVAIGAAAALGGFDGELAQRAEKSFGYRWEYWKSTLAMIARYPWLGVGPGNFQDYYTQFKLPEASEEVRDPHNFLLEVWATCGTFAFVALVEVLALIAWRAWQGPATTDGETPDAKRSKRVDGAVADTNRNATFMLAGAALGVALAFIIGPSVGLPFSEGVAAAVLATGAAVVAALWPWIVGGMLAPRLPAVALTVLAVDLLASGGITIPGVANSFWMLMALGLNELAAEPVAPVHVGPAWRRRLAPAIGLAGTCLAAVACYQYAYGPITHARAAMLRAEAPRASLDARRKAYLDAAQADPLSADAWTALAELELGALRGDQPPGPALARFATACEKVTELRPHSAAAWRKSPVGTWTSTSGIAIPRPPPARWSASRTPSIFIPIRQRCGANIAWRWRPPAKRTPPATRRNARSSSTRPRPTPTRN